MTERQCIELLKAIQKMALLPYPWPADAKPIPDLIAYALGEVAAITGRVITLMEGGLSEE